MTEYNKVVYDGQTLIDLTQDDVTASDVRNGVYFHSADGVRGQGTLLSRDTNLGSFIKLQGAESSTITLSTTDKYPAMSELVEKQGSAFAHDTTNNCIECLVSGIVLFSASIKLYNNFTASDIIGYGLYNDTQSTPFNSTQYRVPANVTAPNQNIITPAFPITVTAGDKIRIRVRNATGARGVVQNENTVLSAIYLAPLFT